MKLHVCTELCAHGIAAIENCQRAHFYALCMQFFFQYLFYYICLEMSVRETRVIGIARAIHLHHFE